MSTVLEIERAAMELSPAERELLANHLLQSLDDAPLTEIDQAWIEEAEQRYEKFKSGQTALIPGDEVFARIRRDLGWEV